MPGYSEDLAYIHDVGFGGFAQRASAGLLRILRRSGISKGLVVDLGCGSGIWARDLSQNGYGVLGVDISPSMIELARRKAPRAHFVTGSLLSVQLPSCDAVTAIGECVNYSFDTTNNRRAVARFFRRVFAALRPGGMLIFDTVEPGAIPQKGLTSKHALGKDWAVLVEAHSTRSVLTRRITSFRKVGDFYRRTEETHSLRPYKASDLSAELARIGFKVRLLRGYGELQFSKAHVGIEARKPRV